MCELYALSARLPVIPRGDLNILQGHADAPFGNQNGWGLSRDIAGWPRLDKAPQSVSHAGGFPGLLTTLQPSKLWLVHLRAATRGGVCYENCQPFHFSVGDRFGAFAHNGQLNEIETHPEFTPHAHERGGNADSECGLIILRQRLMSEKTEDDVWRIFQTFGRDMRDLGPANFIVRIDDMLFAQSDRRMPVGYDELTTPGLTCSENNDDIRLSSEPLSPDYVDMRCGEQIWIRGGEIVDRVQ